MLDAFFIQLSTEPETISFEQSIEVIDQHYHFTPSAFQNGQQANQAGENNGACKILAFGQLHQLSEPQTLQMFGHYYQQVIATPAGTDHQNIRHFMRTGWDGVAFSQSPLRLKHS